MASPNLQLCLIGLLSALEQSGLVGIRRVLLLSSHFLLSMSNKLVSKCQRYDTD